MDEELRTEFYLARERERAIIRKLVEDALRQGLTVRHDDGEQETARVYAKNEASMPMLTDVIMKEINATDIEYLSFYAGESRIGYVVLVYGNDGHDVIADHTDSTEMEKLLAGANALAESFYDEWCKDQLASR